MAADHRERVPLNTWAIAFGLTGLAKVWTLASPSLGINPVVVQSIWGVAAAAWLALLLTHIVRGIQSRQPLVDQLRHPAQGPLAAIVPVTGMLLGADLARFYPVLGAVVVAVAIATAAVFAGWLISTWLEGRLELPAIHGGYLIPTVAAGFIASASAEQVGLTALAWGCFAVGLVFWAVMMTLVLLRLTIAPALPGPLVPTMAILLAPPAIAGVAWLSLNDGQVGDLTYAFAGTAVLMLVLQLALVPRYRRTEFSLGFWSFTFPFAATCALAIGLTGQAGIAAQRVVSLIALIACTLLVAAIGYKSLRLVLIARARVVGPVEELTEADDQDASSSGPGARPTFGANA